MPALGYVDELIRHIDSGKKVFQMLSVKPAEWMSWVKIDTHIATRLAVTDKYSLPTLGQFYRPLDDLDEQQRKNGNYQFNMYAEGYELDMIRFPPAPAFILEFAGFDQNLRITTKTQQDVSFAKYVLLCEQLHPDTISITAFYYCGEAFDTFPVGWVTAGVTFTLKYISPEHRTTAACGHGHGVAFSTEETIRPETAGGVLSSMWPELRALFQFLVVMNVKNGVIRSQASTKRTMVARTGRQLGYTYHVLDIDPNYVSERRTLGGTHASPRFHMRRAHLRWFEKGTPNAWFTFIRRMKVGNPIHGIVDKDYNVKPLKDQ